MLSRKLIPKSIELGCLQCKKLFFVPYRLRHRLFCSNSCRGLYQSETSHTVNPFYLKKFVSERKGKSNEQLFGKERALEISMNIRESKLGEKNPMWKGELKKKKIRLSEDELVQSRKRQGEKMREVWKRPGFKERVFTVDSNEKRRVSHLRALSEGKYANKKDTDLERAIEKELINAGLELNKDYFKQVRAPKGNERYVVDFHLPYFGSLVIEGFGCWYHKCKQCGYSGMRDVDKRKLEILTNTGYNVLVVWGHQVKNGTFLDLDQLLSKSLITH